LNDEFLRVIDNRRNQMTNVFGSPIYVHSADDRSEDAKTTTSRIEEALKTLKPLDKARTYLENAAKALDGTGYEEIKKGIAAVVQNITTTEQQVVAKLGGEAQSVAAAAQPAAKPAVPTAGQISGAEPLPEA
jgi:hypothetical protein